MFTEINILRRLMPNAKGKSYSKFTHFKSRPQMHRKIELKILKEEKLMSNHAERVGLYCPM